MEYRKDIAQEMLMYQTKCTSDELQSILVSTEPCFTPPPKAATSRQQRDMRRCRQKSLISLDRQEYLSLIDADQLNYGSLVYPQNTKEKFDAEPEDCDQKEMYKLLVCLCEKIRPF